MQRANEKEDGITTIDTVLSSLHNVNDPNVRVRIVKIYPDQAKALLKHNKKNRNLLKRIALQYVKSLKEDRWQLNGSTIIISLNNTLLDGQHRLKACVMSGKPVTTVLVTGVNPNAIRTLDIGKKRTDSDFLKMQGYKSSIQIAPTFSQAIAYKNGSLNPKGYNILSMINQNESAQDFFDRLGFGIIEKSVTEGRKFDREAVENLLPATRLAAIHLILVSEGITSFEYASGFIRKLATGANCKPNDPVFQALGYCRNVKGQGVQLEASQRMLIMINAWNKFVSGVKMKRQTPRLLDKPKFMKMKKPTVSLFIDSYGYLQRH